MAKIKMSEGGYIVLPEGKHVFKIIESDYDEDFGVVKIQMVTASGTKHTENFHLLTKDGEVNEGANKAFSYFAKTALNNMNLEEIDHDDIVGCYIEIMVEHDVQPHNKDPKKTVTFLRLRDKYPASGFGTVSGPVGGTGKVTQPTGKGQVNLDDLLG